MKSERELEVKYRVADLERLRERVEALGGELVQPRTFERNLRFDTPDGSLSRGYRVLRLRRDSAARLTYKGPAESRGGVRLRQEIEFEVSDFDAARHFLEALGYRVSVVYEKYRAAYRLRGVLVTLDELPYGDFAELEGETPESIRAVGDLLGLRWEARLPESYLALFERARRVLGWNFQNLVFANFEGMPDPLAPLKLPLADK
ncbi:MAG TPA: CYTH domain-containing protein [Chloroflexi bacterium]|nr:CYTH domain-containing protein [Chloroflexota bacterium]